MTSEALDQQNQEAMDIIAARRGMAGPEAKDRLCYADDDDISKIRREIRRKKREQEELQLLRAGVEVLELDTRSTMLEHRCGRLGR